MVASKVLAGTFILVALLHAFWALGGTWALEESLGEGNPIPPTWLIWMVALLAVVAALGVLARVGLWGKSIPRLIPLVGAWALFVCLIGVTVLNASTGRPWEMYLIAPICAVLAVLALIVARFKRDFQNAAAADRSAVSGE